MIDIQLFVFPKLSDGSEILYFQQVIERENRNDNNWSLRF